MLQSIADQDTTVYVDMLAYMSLRQGVRVADARLVPFRHDDLDRLRAAISRNEPGIDYVGTLVEQGGDWRLCGSAADFVGG